ncbi:MAG: F0F1 ATP synthase subunit epsilon [bacterium]
MESYLLTIVTPEKKIIEQQIRSLIAPGSEGYLGILAHHTPILTSLVPGKLTIKDTTDSETFFAISGGFLEVAGNKATILADAIEKAEDIDLMRAQQAETRAREILTQSTRDSVEFTHAEACLERALNRIEIFNGHNPKK